MFKWRWNTDKLHAYICFYWRSGTHSGSKSRMHFLRSEWTTGFQNDNQGSWQPVRAAGWSTESNETWMSQSSELRNFAHLQICFQFQPPQNTRFSISAFCSLLHLPFLFVVCLRWRHPSVIIFSSGSSGGRLGGSSVFPTTNSAFSLSLNMNWCPI